MNKRKFSRVNFKVSASIRVGDQTFYGVVENLSMNGMLLITDASFPVGQSVETTIFLEGSDPAILVCCNGRVSRTQENSLGITFEKIELDSYTHLRNVISYNIKDTGKVTEEIHNFIDEKLISGK